ncbi:MAG: type II toxin-antitoxin system VapC family toxin [Chloroflexi bacterium]|nr:type II toxin-antitoxin system VapC family toxin [Chloroflexota bacterium]
MRRAYVDTNVILRFLTGDPPDMAAQAGALFEAVERGEVTLVIDEIVVAETVWVLHSFYGHPHHDIARVMQELLSHKGLEADDKPGLLAALHLFAEKNVDFADALVAVHMERRGMREIFSFDGHFDRLPGITRRSPGE